MLSGHGQAQPNRVPVNVVGSSMFGRYEKISPEKTYNMFISDGWLVNFAGYKKFIQLFSEGEGRGLFKSSRSNFLIAVINSQVFKVEPNYTFQMIGTIQTVTGEVSIDENLASQICICDGLYAYIYTYSSTPTFVQQSLGFEPGYVCYHNTFFLISSGLTVTNGNWYAYITDGTGIALSATLALQTKPDSPQAVVRIPGQSNNVLVIGRIVSEVWTQVGGSVLPYRRNSTINVDYGCGSPSTIATSDNFVIWLGVNENNSPVIMVYSGQGAQRLSTDGIDYLLSQIKYPSQSTAMMYRQDGHLFYQLTFYNQADNLTLMYDFNTEKFFHLSDSDLNYHPAREYVYFNNGTFFISLKNACIYQSSTNFVVNDENLGVNKDPKLISDIQRIRVCGNYQKPDTSRFIATSLTMNIEQGCDPNVTQLALDSYETPIITEAWPFRVLPILVASNEPILTEGGVPMVEEGAWSGALVRNNPPYQPRLDLSVSRDGGVTWSNTVGKTLNPIGQRPNIITWNRLGAANTFTCKFRFWGMSRFVVNNSVLDTR